MKSIKLQCLSLSICLCVLCNYPTIVRVFWYRCNFWSLDILKHWKNHCAHRSSSLGNVFFLKQYLALGVVLKLLGWVPKMLLNKGRMGLIRSYDFGTVLINNVIQLCFVSLDFNVTVFGSQLLPSSLMIMIVVICRAFANKKSQCLWQLSLLILKVTYRLG